MRGGASVAQKQSDGAMRTILSSFACSVLFAAGLIAGPVEDLASPSQETRDAAAKVLRETAQAVPKEKWEPLMQAMQEAVKKGETKPEILERLKPFKTTTEIGMGGGKAYTESYRLDDYWVLRCVYRTEADTLSACELQEQMRRVWIDPPADFTGVWTTYYANGRRSHEIHYAEGKYSGTFTSFRADGSMTYVQTYDRHTIDGEELGFYPSGKVMYRSYYRKGKQIGTWTSYHEDGTVKGTREFPEK
jgi:hypothetical protein